MRTRPRLPARSLSAAVARAGLLLAIPACLSHERLETVRDFRRDVEPVPAPTEDSALRDFRGILHCHSIYSHDAKGTLEEIGRAAEIASVDFLVMTDHTNPDAFTHGWRGLKGRTLFLLGQEISKRGSLLAIGTKRFVDPQGKSPQEIVDDVASAGGLAFIGHFEKTRYDDLSGFAGVGIVNLHAAWRERGILGVLGSVLDLLYSGRSFADEVFLETLAIPSPLEDNLRRFDDLARRRRIVAISETDSHGVARFLGIQIDPYARLFEVVSTHVFARDLDEESILDALASGHAYVTFDGYAPSRGFQFEAIRGTRVVAIQGDEIDLGDGIELLARLPFEASIRLVRNGEAIAEADGQRLAHTVTLPGAYRVEASLSLGGRKRPWIFSNPIYVR